jgi:hypothetical protein
MSLATARPSIGVIIASVIPPRMAPLLILVESLLILKPMFSLPIHLHGLSMYEMGA